jgi:hypothetical protein
MSQGSVYGWGESPLASAWPSASASASSSPSRWGTMNWGDTLKMFGHEGSVSPQQARAPSPMLGVEQERSLSPKRLKERNRSQSPLLGTIQSPIRGPRIFIINCHGVTFPNENGNPAMIDDILVDTFTSVKFAHGFGKYLYNAQTCSFFDEPYRYFIDRVLETTKENPDSLQKDVLRETITRSLCYVRDVKGVIVKDKCKFKCHRVGRKMADMYIMGAGSPMDDVVICIDPLTGDEEDVHDKFGLRQLDERPVTYAPGVRKEIDKAFNIAIRKAERELEDLRSQILVLSEPHLRTQENMDIVKKLRKKYDEKYLKLNINREALRDAVQGPKYRYKFENLDKYAVLEGKHYMIKLSDALDIAVRNGTIDPRKDIVVVEACRNFYGQLPSGYDTTKSPGRAGSESDSQGGGGHAKCKYSRKKYGKDKGRNKNRNKNRNKRKTIRNRKSGKSRNSRKSRRSYKHSNSS